MNNYQPNIKIEETLLTGIQKKDLKDYVKWETIEYKTLFNHSFKKDLIEINGQNITKQYIVNLSPQIIKAFKIIYE